MPPSVSGSRLAASSVVLAGIVCETSGNVPNRLSDTECMLPLLAKQQKMFWTQALSVSNREEVSFLSTTSSKHHQICASPFFHGICIWSKTILK
ncbi:unnamed protein product, partial [Protopolystoma xenopodis]